MFLSKAKSRLPNENVACSAATHLWRKYVPRKSDNVINAITMLKRRLEMRKMHLLSENVETKSKTRLPSENFPRKCEKLVTRQNVSRKGENASS